MLCKSSRISECFPEPRKKRKTLKKKKGSHKEVATQRISRRLFLIHKISLENLLLIHNPLLNGEEAFLSAFTNTNVSSSSSFFASLRLCAKYFFSDF